MLPTPAALLLAAVVAAEPASSDAGSRGAVAGTVTLTDARGEQFAAPGVQLTLDCAGKRVETQTSASDEFGAFRFLSVRADHCSISTDLQGFEPITTDLVVEAGETTQVELHLAVMPVDAGIQVVARSTSSSPGKRFK